MQITERIWLVEHNGEQHVITKMPLEGLSQWLKGQQLTAAQYTFEKTIFPPDVAVFCDLIRWLYP